MKKAILFLLMFAWFLTNAQNVLRTHATFNLNGSKFTWVAGTDSIASVYADKTFKFFGPQQLGQFTTTNMNALTNGAGKFIFNIDSGKLAFNDGSQWIFVGGTPGAVYTAGNGLSLSTGLFKWGGTLSENTTIDNAATYYTRIGNGSTKYLHITAAGAVCINNVSPGGYDFNVSGLMNVSSGGYSFSTNGAWTALTSITDPVTYRLVGTNKRWDITAGNGRFVINPVTANDSFMLQDNSQHTILKVQTDTKDLFLYSVKKSTNPLGIFVHNPDSSVAKISAVPVSMGGMPAGGIVGYGLRKASGSDYDYEWAAVTATGDLSATPLKIGLHIVSDADYTVGTNDCIIIFSNLSAARTLTLPSASTNANRILKIKNGGSGAFNINLSATVRENASVTASTVAQSTGIIIISDGTEWWLVGAL